MNELSVIEEQLDDLLNDWLIGRGFCVESVLTVLDETASILASCVVGIDD